MPNKDYQELYLIAIYEISSQQTFYTIAPNNREFACLLDIINPEEYCILTVMPLANFVDFKDLMKILMTKNKPDNLNFGKEGNF